MYEFLRHGTHGFGEWSEILRYLKVCEATIHRYISLARIIQAYPRLVVCDLSFEMIVSSGKRLMGYLESEPDLRARLSIPLRTTEVQGKSVVYTATKLPSGGTVEKTDLMSHVDWSPCWEFSDMLLDSRVE